MIIISNALDNSSSGLVVRYFTDKARFYKHQVLGVFEEVSKENRLENIFWLDEVKVFTRISKVFLILFGISPQCLQRAHRAYSKYFSNDLKEEKHAYIFLTSVNFFAIYLLLNLIKNKPYLKIHLHFLDTFISNNSWGENKYVTNAKRRVIKSTLSNNINNINFSFTNDKARKLIQDIIGFEFTSKLYYSYPVNDYYFQFQSPSDRKILLYFRGTLDSLRNADFVLETFNSISKLIPNLYCVFQGKISTNLDVRTLENIEIREFSTDKELLQKADIFLDVDLFLEDVFIPGKFFEYLSFKKPILSITPFNSALRGLIQTDLQENDLIILSDFNYQNVLKNVQQLLVRFEKNMIGQVRFNKIQTLDALLIGADK